MDCLPRDESYSCRGIGLSVMPDMVKPNFVISCITKVRACIYSALGRNSPGEYFVEALFSVLTGEENLSFEVCVCAVNHV